MASVLYSMFLCGMSTFGSVSVLVYVWSEMFKLNANLAAWVPAIMGASYQMTGRGLYCTDCNGQPNQLCVSIVPIIITYTDHTQTMTLRFDKHYNKLTLWY